MLEIDCAGERLGLLAEKAIFWRRQSALIIADLHLGKSAAFRKAGVPVPEGTTTGDLERLQRIIQQTGSERIIILGDLFHAHAGLQPEMLDSVTAWREENAGLQIVLVPGNHDLKSGSPPSSWRIEETESSWSCPPFVFCHDENKSELNGYSISGHLHPAICLRETFGPVMRMPCFCFGKCRAILPAFGSFTGNTTIRAKPDERIYVINSSENQIVEATSLSPL